MEIPSSIEGVVGFAKANQELIDEIRSAGSDAQDVLSGLSDRLEEHRTAAQKLIDGLGQIQFSRASSADVRGKQAVILREIEDVGKRITLLQDHPELLGGLHNRLAMLYQSLASTYNDLIPSPTNFTEAEVDHLRNLMRRAILDTESRKRAAAILDGAVSLAKLGLKLGAKLVL